MQHQLREHAHHHDAVIDRSRGERRTLWVVVIATIMMITELVVGNITGSLALTADGWHMATHVGALGMTFGAYWYARTRAGSDEFTFGTGKVYALAGYTSGIVLAVVAGWMGYEAIEHLLDRPDVDFGQALPVAALGLSVNLVSAILLGHGHDHGGHGHDHDEHGHDEHEHDDDGHDHDDHAGHDHDHAGHDHDDHAGHDHDHDHDGRDHDHHDHDHAGHDHDSAASHDHNLRAAYLHVLADAVTSLLAIGALVAGRYAGAWYLDPIAGMIGGAVVLSWSISLCRGAGRQLLDVVPSRDQEKMLRAKLEAVDDVRIADLHVWEIGPGRRGCIVSLVTAAPRDIDYYRGVILGAVDIAHLTVEVHCCSRAHA